MERNIKFSVESIQKVKFEDYPEDKFGVARTCFLSTKKNSHELNIKENVLREHANSILGNFLVAKMSNGDATSHMSDEVIMGYFPKEQEVEFEEVEENDNKILKAYAYAVISKQYAKSFYDIFVTDNQRNTSVEMKVTTPEDDETDVLAFDIYGLTCLGKWVNGSCPDANMTMVRFSENEADEFFNKIHTDHLTVLKTFAKKRRENMAESKTYKVDKSKEALSTKPWGEVDKTDLRNKILEASNKTSLVKDVYMLVEAGWEEAPSEKLKYPVMSFNGDTLVYNRDGLASALGYAKKENETAVVSKVEKIYKKLDLDDGKEEDKKMADVKLFSQLEGRELYAEVIKRVQDKLGKNMYVEQVYSDHVVVTNEHSKEVFDIPADIKIGKDDEDMHIDIDYDKMKKSKDQVKFERKEDKKLEDDDDDEDKDDEDEDKKLKKKDKKMSEDEMMAKIAKMEADIEARDNIIMEKDKELEELRAFKKSEDDKQKAMSVEATMEDVKDCFEADKFKELREEGLACDTKELDAWANKVKSFAFESVKGGKKKANTNGIWTFSAVNTTTTETTKSMWK